MTDNKSFETVELFNPIELTPIDGIEMPKPVAMPEPVAEQKTVAVQKPAAEKEPVAVPEKAKGSSIWDEIHKKSAPEFYQQGNDVQYDQSGLNQGNYDQNKNYWRDYGSGWVSEYAYSYDSVNYDTYNHGSAVENQSFFDKYGNVLPSIKVFNHSTI